MVTCTHGNTHLVQQGAEVVVVNPGYEDGNECATALTRTEYINTTEGGQAVVEGASELLLMGIDFRGRVTPCVQDSMLTSRLM